MSLTATKWAWAQKCPSSTAKSILVYLANLANGEDDCYPSMKTICEATQYTARAVRKAITELEEAGLLKVSRQEENTRKTSNTYVLNVLDSADQHHQISTIKRQLDSANQHHQKRRKPVAECQLDSANQHHELSKKERGSDLARACVCVSPRDHAEAALEYAPDQVKLSDGRIGCNGWDLEGVADKVFYAARVDPSQWRGDLKPLIRWLWAENEPHLIVRAIEDFMAKVGERPRSSFAIFDNWVAAAHRRNLVGAENN